MTKLFKTQKQMELRQVELALTEMGFGRCTSALRAGESPDVIFPLGGRSIGIEVVEFFYPTGDLGDQDGDVPHWFQNLRHIAVEKARSRFRDNGGPPLYVTVTFSDYPSPQGPKSTPGTDEFAERFQRVVTSNGWSNDPLVHWPFRFHPDIPEVAHYVVSPSIDDQGELWACGGAANGALVEPEHVQDVLSSKAEKYERYAAKCDAVWLLIVNGGAIRTVPCELGDDARNASYSFPFERAFWFDRMPPSAPIALKRLTFLPDHTLGVCAQDFATA